jgi:hypothetical protein
MLDDLLWALAGLLPAAPAATWLDVPLGEGTIGPEWPQRRAIARGAAIAPAPDGGLIPDLSVLGHADRVHPLVRLFYEHTARFALAVDPRWTPGFALGGWRWSALYARRWGQLSLPLAAGVPLTNEIYSSEGGQWWVRRYPDDRALYVSRYEVIAIDGQPDPCVRIAFPVPGGAWVVLFRVVHDGAALVLTEDGGTAGGPGLYLLRTGRPPRYFRAFREEIRVFPTHRGCRAVHRMWLAGMPLVALNYELPVAR